MGRRAGARAPIGAKRMPRPHPGWGSPYLATCPSGARGPASPGGLPVPCSPGPSGIDLRVLDGKLGHQKEGICASPGMISTATKITRVTARRPPGGKGRSSENGKNKPPVTATEDASAARSTPECTCGGGPQADGTKPIRSLDMDWNPGRYDPQNLKICVRSRKTRLFLPSRHRS